MPRSPLEVGVEVVAGLIAIASHREGLIDELRLNVEAVVRELDPEGKMDHAATWWAEHPQWERRPPFVRFRTAFEDLMLLETQAKEIVDSLRVMLTPGVVKPSGVPHPVEAHRRLVHLAERRTKQIRVLELAVRAVRKGLSPVTAAELRRCIREIRSEEERATQYRTRLGRLLSMGDLVDQAV